MSINNNGIEVLQDQKWQSISWKKLQVGDIVKVSVLCISVLVYFDMSIFWTSTSRYWSKNRSV